MFKTSTYKAAVILSVLAAANFGCSSGDKEKKSEEKDKVADVYKKAPKVYYDQAGKEDAEKKEQEPQEENKNQVTRAFCIVNPKSGSHVIGAITFVKVQEGVRIIADIGGLTPGKHGFHVHEHGDCSSADASSAGAHFNPTDKKHGGPDSPERHVGDFGNLEANEHGFAHYDRVDKVISLDGKDSIIGKSIIIHQDPDDLISQPSGNSGKRVACGVIVAAN